MQKDDDLRDRYLSRQALLALTRLSGVLEDIFSMHYARFGLSAPKFNALVHLYMTGDRGLIQSELSKKMLVSRANITALLERMEKEGLVVRKGDPADKRVFRVCLTDRAFRLMEAFLPVHNEYMHQVMFALDSQEKETLIRLLNKLNTSLDLF